MYKIIKEKIVKNECFYRRLEAALTESKMWRIIQNDSEVQ